VCEEEMYSWFHLEDHQSELQQRLKNPTDRVILQLKEYGCIVRKAARVSDVDYRGYTVRSGLLGEFFVGHGQKDHWISCHRSEQEAKQTIDKLVCEGEAPCKP